MFEHIQPKAMGHGHTTAADGPDRTTAAPIASGTVPLSLIRIIDGCKAVQQDIADVGGKLPAGVNLPIRKKGNKIESSAAAVPGAPTEGFNAFFATKDVHEIVLQTDDGIGAAGFHVGFQKSNVWFLFREMEFGAFPYEGQTIECEKVGFFAEKLRKRDHLIHVIPGQCEHDHGVDAHFAKAIKELQGSMEVPWAADVVIV